MKCRMFMFWQLCLGECSLRQIRPVHRCSNSVPSGKHDRYIAQPDFLSFSVAFSVNLRYHFCSESFELLKMFCHNCFSFFNRLLTLNCYFYRNKSTYHNIWVNDTTHVTNRKYTVESPLTTHFISVALLFPRPKVNKPDDKSARNSFAERAEIKLVK